MSATAAPQREPAASVAPVLSTTVTTGVSVSSSPVAPAYSAPGDVLSIALLPEGFVPRHAPMTVAQEVSPAGYALVSQQFINEALGQTFIVSVTSGMPAVEQLGDAGPVIDGVLSERTVYAISDEVVGQRDMAWAADATTVVWLYGTSMSEAARCNRASNRTAHLTGNGQEVEDAPPSR